MENALLMILFLSVIIFSHISHSLIREIGEIDKKLEELEKKINEENND